MTIITHKYIETVDNFKDSVVVWLNPVGRKALNIKDAFEINSYCGCATIDWDDRDFGDQEIQIAPGGSEDARILDYMLNNPESAIEYIENRLKALKEEAAHRVTDIRRGLIDNTPALLFKVDGQDLCEWLDDNSHTALEGTYSNLRYNCRHLFLDREFVENELKEWLAENPVKIEWAKGNDSMDGGSYDTLAEAEAALESVKAEFLAQCGTDEDRANIEAGEFRIIW